MALVALVPLLVALSGWTGRPGVYAGGSAGRGFRLGFAAGAVHYLGTVYWTGAVVQTFGGLSWPVALLAMLALVAYMATYIALAGAATAVCVARFGAPGLFVAPLAWTACEYARGHVLGGFPWIPLGNAVVDLLPLAQVASAVGVYGLSGLVALVAVLIVFAMTGRARAVAGLTAAALLGGVSVWGALRIRDGVLTRTGELLTVGLVQANVAQVDKWNPARGTDILERHVRMTREAAAAGAQAVLWPESSTPFMFDEDPQLAAEVRAAARAAGVPLLFGTDEVERGRPDRYFNSAFVLDQGGATAGVYRKMKLVPFGEYVPLKDLLFFVAPLVEGVSEFSPGVAVTMMPLLGHMAATAVCYEVVYPELARAGVLRGAELLTTITNDGWYGESSAPYQHFEAARMRAIEQGRYLARAANTGISGIVDPYGRVTLQTGIFEARVAVGQVRTLRTLTTYATIGDVVPQAAVVCTLLAVALASLRRARGPDRR